MDEPNDIAGVTADETPPAGTPAPGSFEEWLNQGPPPHAVEAHEAFLAELDELLAHRAAHPDERWVAYRGRRRLGFGTDQQALHRECLERFPDGRFCVCWIERPPEPGSAEV